MRSNPIFKADFLLGARSKKFTRIYFWFLLTITLILWINWPSSLPYGDRVIRGEPLDLTLVMLTLQMILIFYLALSLSSGVVMVEGELSLRDLLVAAPRDKGFIIRAKVANYLIQSLLLLISPVPLVVLATTVSSLDIKTLPKAYAILIGLIIGLGGIGFFFSVVLRITLRRIANWGVILFCWIITYIIDQKVPFSFKGWRLIHWNPFVALFSLSENKILGNKMMEMNIWEMCLWGYIILGVIFVGLTVWWIKKKLPVTSQS